MDFLLGNKNKNRSKMGNQVVKMLGIDSGTIFVFTSGPQIDLWTELGVKKWAKPAFFLGLDPKIGSKFSGPLGFFRWRVNISKWVKIFQYHKLGSLFPGNERNFWPKKFPIHATGALRSLFIGFEVVLVPPK